MKIKATLCKPSQFETLKYTIISMPLHLGNQDQNENSKRAMNWWNGWFELSQV